MRIVRFWRVSRGSIRSWIHGRWFGSASRLSATPLLLYYLSPLRSVPRVRTRREVTFIILHSKCSKVLSSLAFRTQDAGTAVTVSRVYVPYKYNGLVARRSGGRADGDPFFFIRLFNWALGGRRPTRDGARRLVGDR